MAGRSGQLHQQLAEEVNQGKVLRDELEKMEAKLTDTENNHEQLQNLSKTAELKLKQQLTEEENKVRNLPQHLD